MNNRNIFYYLITFVVYVLFQIVFLKDLSLFGFALCFAYIGFLLTLPVESSPVSVLLVGFGLGLTTDIFYDTLGIHAAACVLMAFVRKPVLQWVRPVGGYDANTRPTVKYMGLQWFVVFALIMVGIHHIALFLISASNLNIFFWTMSRALGSTAFTVAVLVFVQQAKKLYSYSRRR